MIFKPDLFNNPTLLSPLTLAFIGDSVYELYVRTRICKIGSMPANKLHRMATLFVKASAQAKSMKAIIERLNEDETAVFRRGRNSKSPTVPKNAVLSEYKIATGFEALIGFLYLKGENERLIEIMDAAYNAIDIKNTKETQK